MFEPSFVRCAFKPKFLLSKLRCHVQFNICTCALIQSKHVINNVGMFKKVEAVLLAASVSFLSTPEMLNPSSNSNRNKTSTRYKAIIQFWRLSIANQGKSNIDKNTCEPSNIHLFLLTELRMLFSNLHPSPKYYILTIEVWQLVIMTSTQIQGIKILVSKYQLSTSVMYYSSLLPNPQSRYINYTLYLLHWYWDWKQTHVNN